MAAADAPVTCASCGETTRPTWRHCTSCGAALGVGAAGAEREHDVTVVVSDLQGSTALAEGLDPETLRQVLDQYFDQLGTVLESHGGRIEKRIGDMMVTVFGLPTPADDDALRAVRAVAECQATLARLNDQLERRWGVRLVNRTGVCTGTIVFAEAGAGHRVLAGPALQYATTLEPIAPPLEALIGVPTLELLADVLETGPVEPLTPKGGGDPVLAARLIAVPGSDDDAGREQASGDDRCSTCGTEIDLQADPAWRWCCECGSPVAVGGRRRESRRTLTIVFGDLRAIDAEPEAARQASVRCFDEIRIALERHGGTVEKYIGDAIMAVWGLERRNEDDALRAIRAALEMQQVVAAWNGRGEDVELELHIGVNTGPVIAGDPRLGQRLVTGDAVNVAARLEQTAGVGQVVIGELTRRLAGDGAEVEELEPLTLKGKAEPVPAYRVVEVQAGVASHGRLELPLVGRDLELRQLVQAWQRATADGRCHRVDVIGDAGVGKSRLVHELLDGVHGGARVLRGACLSYGEGITFWPIVEVIQAAAAVGSTDPPDLVRAQVAELVGGDEELALRLWSLVGVHDVQYSVAELFWAVRRALESIAADHPVVLVVDGVHWAEPTLLDLLNHLTDRLQAPLLLITMTRQGDQAEEVEDDDEATGTAERPRTTRLTVGPLLDAEADAVMELAIGGGTLPDRLRERIRMAAAGNPLFIEQFLTMLIDDGLLADHDGRWRVVGDLEQVKVPATIEAVLTARVDAIGDDERAAIEPAAVIGRDFPQAAIESLADATVDAGDALASLRQRQLVTPARDPDPLVDHRFRSLLLRDVVYGGLLKRERSQLHQRFADWLEALPALAGRRTELAEIIGYHLEQAFHLRTELSAIDDELWHMGERATELLGPAGERAYVRGDLPAATKLLSRAAATLGPTDHRRARLMFRAGEACIGIGEFREALAHFDEAEAAARQSGDEVMVHAAELARTTVRHLTGDGVDDKAARETVARLVPVFEAAGDHGQLARAYILEGQINLTHCQWQASEESMAKVLHEAILAGDEVLVRLNRPILAFLALRGPQPVDLALDRCYEVLREVGADQRARASIEPWLGQVLAMHDEVDEARRLCLSARERFEELGVMFDAALVGLELGPIELLAGDPVAAEAALRHGYDLLAEMGEQSFISTVGAWLAEAVRRQGRLEEAHELIDQAAAIAMEDDVLTQAVVRLVRAKLSAAGGSYDVAAAHARAAVRLLDDTDDIITLADARLDLAEILLANGNAASAATEGRVALDLYVTKGSRPGVRRATALLESLKGEGALA